MNWLVTAGLGVLALYALFCCALYVWQDRLLYFPSPAAEPAGATAITIPSGGVSLKVWQLHPDRANAILYFGGNAEDVAAKIGEYDAAFPDHTVYLVHYRGYGGTDGRPSEPLLIADAQAVHDVLHPRHRRMSVMGRSLGSGVATALATTRKVDTLILVTPYDSIAAVAADHYGWAPVHWLIRDRYDSALRIGSLTVPVLVIVAGRDEVIRRSRANALLAAIPASLRRLQVFEQANHNDITLQPGYRECVRSFLAQHDS